MTNKQKKELLKIIDERLQNSGIGYKNSYPEDDVESRRDWDNVHEDWSNAIYGLLEVKNIIENI